jgi:hypothetical protein
LAIGGSASIQVGTVGIRTLTFKFDPGDSRASTSAFEGTGKRECRRAIVLENGRRVFWESDTERGAICGLNVDNMDGNAGPDMEQRETRGS